MIPVISARLAATCAPVEIKTCFHAHAAPHPSVLRSRRAPRSRAGRRGQPLAAPGHRAARGDRGRRGRRLARRQHRHRPPAGRRRPGAGGRRARREAGHEPARSARLQGPRATAPGPRARPGQAVDAALRVVAATRDWAPREIATSTGVQIDVSRTVAFPAAPVRIDARGLHAGRRRQRPVARRPGGDGPRRPPRAGHAAARRPADASGGLDAQAARGPHPPRGALLRAPAPDHRASAAAADPPGSGARRGGRHRLRAGRSAHGHALPPAGDLRPADLRAARRRGRARRRPVRQRRPGGVGLLRAHVGARQGPHPIGGRQPRVRHARRRRLLPVLRRDRRARPTAATTPTISAPGT